MSEYVLFKVTDYSKEFVRKWLEFDHERPLRLADNGALMMLLAEERFKMWSPQLNQLKLEYYSLPRRRNFEHYQKFILNTYSALSNPGKEMIETDFSLIKISPSFHAFGREIEFKCYTAGGFGCKLLPTDFVIHSKQAVFFLGEHFTCSNDYKGPIYETKFQFSDVAEILDSMKPTLNNYTSFIVECYPKCNDLFAT